MTQNEAFGERAAQWAGRLPAALPLITFEFTTIAAAFPSAVRRRRSGEAFLAALILDDPRTKCAVEFAAPSVTPQARDYDHARELFEALANQKLVSPAGLAQSEWIKFDPSFIQGAFELLLCADAVVFRSVSEANRIQAGFRRFANVIYAAPVDARVPPPRAAIRARPQIVVWAPDFSSAECSLIAFGLAEFHLPIAIICKDPHTAAAGPIRYAGLAQAAGELDNAVAIVDASLYDPGSAIALARFGVPLASASTSGAHDWLQGLAVYDPWNFESVFEAAANALGASAPRALRAHEPEAELRAGLEHAAACELTSGPRVTCVLPTYNRPESLALALESVERQTYDNYEVIVVNDAGSPVDDIVARFKRARLLNLAQNVGMVGAVNAGVAEGTGTYLALLADDDEYFPDHFARLVSALERTGASVASTGELGLHHERARDGSLVFIGYSTVRTVPASYTRLLLQNMIGGPSIMVRLQAFRDIGGWDALAGHLADFDGWMKLAEKYDFVHVDRLTAAMSFRTDASQLSAIAGRSTASLYRTIYSRLPRPPRPGIERKREEHLAKIEKITLVQAQPTVRVSDPPQVGC